MLIAAFRRGRFGGTSHVPEVLDDAHSILRIPILAPVDEITGLTAPRVSPAAGARLLPSQVHRPYTYP